MANILAANLTACSFHNRRRRSLYANPPGLENQRMAKHLVISGRVQGVGFRYSMSDEAERLGVTGWVRNRRDGTVEAVIDGAPDAVEGILAWARRGPRGASVTGVEVSEIPGSFEGFELRPTE
jgi:acylphosphatase